MDVNVVIKWVLTAIIVVAVSELSKRSTLAGAVLASLPIVSVLAISWIYLETGDTERIAQFSIDTIWLVAPSLVFFVVLPPMLRAGQSFALSMGAATTATVVAYGLTVKVMQWVAGRGGV
ncbi:MAG: hypothetical protein ACI82G_002441 [Bradymonadia bacterium]